MAVERTERVSSVRGGLRYGGKFSQRLQVFLMTLEDPGDDSQDARFVGETLGCGRIVSDELALVSDKVRQNVLQILKVQLRRRDGIAARAGSPAEV